MKLANKVYLTRAGMRRGCENPEILSMERVRAIFSERPPARAGCTCPKCGGGSEWSVHWVGRTRLAIGCVRFSPNDVKAVRAYLGKRPRKARAK